MKQLLSFFAAGILLAAGFALGQDVRYNFDKNTDFSKLRTYKWVTIKDKRQELPMNYQLVARQMKLYFVI